jgi:hypothetical protein
MVKRIIELAHRCNAKTHPNPKTPPPTAGVADPEETTEHLQLCIERLCLALASVLLYPTNHERMIATGGLEEMIRLCKVTPNPIILRSLGKVIATMVPSPEEIMVTISCMYVMC